MFPQESNSPLVAHFEGAVNNSLARRRSAMAEHKESVRQDGFHCRNSPVQARHRQLDEHPRSATVQNVHEEIKEISPDDVDRAGFHLLSSPLYASEKNKLAPSEDTRKTLGKPLV